MSEIPKTTVKRMNEKRVNANATRPATIDTTPIRNTLQEKFWVGSKKTSFGYVPIRDAKPWPIAGTIATASAAVSPPGIHHVRSRTNDAKANAAKNASATSSCQRSRWESGILVMTSNVANAVAKAPKYQRMSGGLNAGMTRSERAAEAGGGTPAVSIQRRL